MRLSFLAVLFPVLLQAQLPSPNEVGVGMGHLHLATADVDASRKFWVDFMGATGTSKLGDNAIYKFPGVLVFVRKAAAAVGQSEGTAVNHLGFKVKDLDAYVANCQKFGFKIAQQMPATRQAFVMNPDNVKVELTEDKTQSAPIAHHHIHFFNTAVLETQAWYAKMFGAKPGKRGRFDAADLPGVNLTFSPADKATEPTKGRAMDHIGFEVKGLEKFAKDMESKGVKFDVPFRNIPKIGLSVAFFTDPWGTYVELTEGLDKF